MQYSIWRVIGSVGYVFGLLFLLLGFYGYLYYKTTWIGQIGLDFTPYQNYALPVIVVGVALMVTGLVADHGAEKNAKATTKQQSKAQIDTCPKCGTARDSDAEYCKKCGIKVE